MRYGLFFNLDLLGDVLIIKINSGIAKKVIKKNDIVALFDHEGILIGYNIFNITRLARIKSTGLIVLPPNELINLINSLLLGAGFKKLNQSLDSGFVAGKICESTKLSANRFKLTINLGIYGKDLVAYFTSPLLTEQLIAIALPGVLMFDGTIVGNEYHICTARELHIPLAENMDEAFVLDEDILPGTDIFQIRRN